MSKFKLITVKRVFILAIIVTCVIVYHTGIKAEKDCLSRGNSANQCAKLNSF